MTDNSTRKCSQLCVILTMLFFIAMFMGPGPGLRLVNPNPDDPNAKYTVFGLPIIYIWALFWYTVQVAVVLTAYLTVWIKNDQL